MRNQFLTWRDRDRESERETGRARLTGKRRREPCKQRRRAGWKRVGLEPATKKRTYVFGNREWGTASIKQHKHQLSLPLKFSGDPPLPADDPSITAAVRRLPPSPPVHLLLLLRRHCFRYAVRSVTVAPNDEDHSPDLLPTSLYFCCPRSDAFTRGLAACCRRRSNAAFSFTDVNSQIQRCSACCRLPLIFSSNFESRNLAGFLSFTGTDLPEFSTSPEWTAYFDAPVEVTCVRVHHCRSSTHRLFSNGLFSLKLRWDPHLIATVEAPQQSSSQDTLASSPPS
ncbi:hypothetical protein LXL04_006330 [Taraxacum kok-saghyz]